MRRERRGDLTRRRIPRTRASGQGVRISRTGTLLTDFVQDMFQADVRRWRETVAELTWILSLHDFLLTLIFERGVTSKAGDGRHRKRMDN